MPNSHFDVKLISRSAGQSAVAAAAYRSGKALQDDRLGKAFDYSNKSDVKHTEIMLPAQAPTWATDRQRLWNEVEKVEKRSDSQLARSITAALPRELNFDQQKALLTEFVETNFTSKGMIADVAMHEITASDGLPNPHAHIMLTLRDVDRQGFGKKNRAWNATHLVQAWRDSWESLTNAHLETAGSEERLSLRSYQEQGVAKEPQFHLGYEAAGLEQDGWVTDRGNRLRDIIHRNEIRELAGALWSEERSWQAETAPQGIWVDEPKDASPAARHTLAVAELVAAGLDRSAAFANELARKATQWWDRAVEAGREMLERVTNSWAAKEQRRGLDRGLER